MLNTIRGIWVFVALLLFSVLHYAITYVGNTINIAHDDYLKIISWLNVGAISLYFVCSFLASIMSKENFVRIGTVTGLLSAVIAVTIFGVATNDMIGKLITITIGLVLGALGGVSSMVIRSCIRNAL
jgi:hypothetical protein